MRSAFVGLTLCGMASAFLPSAHLGSPSSLRAASQATSAAVRAPKLGLRMSSETEAKADGFGASHTSFYTNAVAKDSYATLDEILNEHMADEGVRQVTKEILDASVKITEALRVNLVTVADSQNSVFGDVQLGVDVIADNLLWDLAKSSKFVHEASSEEEPEIVKCSEDGQYVLCWDPL